MSHHLATFSLLLILSVSQTTSFLWGGGCCGAPVVASGCCGGATSWAYAPPQIIGYERIPLYAKVPMPAPQAYVRTRPVTVVQSQPYYSPPPPPPPAPPVYQSPSYYPPSTNNVDSAPVSSVSVPLTSAIVPPQDKYNDGDVIVIETDDARRRRMSSSLHHSVQPPPTGYVSSQPVAPQGYEVQPAQQQPIMGQVENGIEVTPDQINSGYQPLTSASQNAIPSSAYEPQSSQSAIHQIASSAAYEATGIAPSARRLRKFKN